MEIWIRNSLIGSASSTVFTEAPGTTTGGGLAVYSVKGMTKTGASAALQNAAQANQAANATPAPALTNNVTSPNPVITAVFNTANSLTSAPVVPIGFYTGNKNVYSTPSTTLIVGVSEGGKPAKHSLGRLKAHRLGRQLRLSWIYLALSQLPGLSLVKVALRRPPPKPS